MLKSMTGFGRCEISESNRKIIVEMKSVNHRYLDIAIKMPKKFNLFEAAIRNLLNTYIKRGKVDIYIVCEELSESNYSLKYNSEIAQQYMRYFREMAEQFSIENDITVSRLSRYPEIFSMEEQKLNEEEVFLHLEKTIKGAAEQFVETRTREGENLKRDLLEKLQNLSVFVEHIEKRSPEVMAEHQKRLEEKVQDLLQDTAIDQNRLLAEVVIYADKTCVDEEIVRLKSHIETMAHTLQQGGSVGRKLDFIVQEMNREANTVLSKSNDLLVAEQGINLKTEIEKIREQIQNIE